MGLRFALDPHLDRKGVEMITVLCLLWCAPVSIHAHSLGAQELIVVHQRDKAAHVLKAPACLGKPIPFSGGGEWSFTCQSLAMPKEQAVPGVRAFTPTITQLTSVEIDGKIRKVKR